MENILDKGLHYLGKTQKTPIKYINIGAMDGLLFDDIRGYASMYGFHGLYVEPIPYLFEKLKQQITEPGNRFENSAISTKDGFIDMLTIDPKPIEEGLLHKCFYGMSSIIPPKNGLGQPGDAETVAKYGQKITVPCMTFESLVNKYNITEFDVISIDTEGHDYEIFKQIDLSKYKPKIIRIEYYAFDEDTKILIEHRLSKAGYKYEITSGNIDALLGDFYDEVEKEYSSEDMQESIDIPENKIEINKNITIVTGLYDLGRENLTSNFSRSFQNYKDKFEELLKAPNNMYLYLPQELADWVWTFRNPENTYIKVMELREIIDFFQFSEQTNVIRQKESWYKQAAWLEESPQCNLSAYNPLVMSKFFFLNDASIHNPFGSEYFFWIDGGITNTVHPGYFYHDLVFNNLENYYKINNKLLFLSYPYIGGEEIHGFERKAMATYAQTEYVEHVCRGGFFGGKKEHINELNGLYWGLLNSSLSEGLMGTEESIFAIMSYLRPDAIHRFILEDNGLVWPFFEELKKHNIAVKPKLPYIYVLTYNSPEQFYTLCKSFQVTDPDILNNTHKVLINNSTNYETFDKYDELCKEFGFEEIHYNNLGICGGRQAAAEHFQQTNSDYYIFFEDDMFLYSPNNEVCRNGFRTYFPELLKHSLEIAIIEKFDYLKLSFTEFYGDNSTQWAWYNVPQVVREEFFPQKPELPKYGLDPNAPRTKFNNIKTHGGLGYAEGEVHYDNWPLLFSKEGNYKTFIETKWAYPNEQTWMSYVFQEQKKGNIKSGVLLLSPINHTRFDFYPANERKES